MALSSSWFCSTTTSLQNTHQLKLNFSFKPLSSTFLAISPLPNPLATKSNAIPFSCPTLINNTNNTIPDSQKWRTRDSLFSALSFFDKPRNAQSLKEELFEAIIPLDRGAEASPEDQDRVEQIAQKLEAINKIKEPLKSELLNGKWELLYTTSKTLLQAQRPRFLRPNGKIYQAINVDTLRAQNLETWPFFNQATANLVPLNSRRVAVKFDSFKIASLIPIKSSGSGRGQLEITYLDEELRISRGNRGNLFVLKMVDPLYRVPL